MMGYITSLRPKQWVKNLFIFAALIFSQNIFHPDLLFKTFLAFVFFSFASSAIYLINDIQDREKDRQHPTKKNRPIASGAVPVKHAAILAVIFFLVAFSGSFSLNISFGVVVFIYVLNNVLYSYFLKNIVLIDVFLIAFGFVLRVVGGAVVISVEISSWLIICTVLLSLFLGFSKRRHELILLNDQATGHRTILKEYSPYFLDQMIGVVTSATVVAYSLYTMSPEVNEKFGDNNLQYTIIFVLYGIFRYLYLVHQKKEGGSPTIALLTDIPLLINVAVWALSVIVIIYYF